MGPILTINIVFCCIFNMNISTTKPHDRDRNRDLQRDQNSIGTWVSTNHRDQKLPGPGPIIGIRNYQDREWSTPLASNNVYHQLNDVNYLRSQSHLLMR